MQESFDSAAKANRDLLQLHQIIFKLCTRLMQESFDSAAKIIQLHRLYSDKLIEVSSELYSDFVLDL